MCRQSATVCLTKSPTRQHRSIGPLDLRLQTLADPRARRGKRHPFVAVLLVACSAVTAGAQSFAAIGQWAKNAPQDVLTRLGARTATLHGVRVAPSCEVIPVVWTRLTMDLVDPGRCSSTWHGPRSAVRSSGPTRLRGGGLRPAGGRSRTSRPI
ncbi:transposase family protein [Streptomyces sp. NBC_01455]|uniref:transposase family protein n=1 Tax=Streptomyces sp. NBC_01455 TaxID=2903874 RepID=UPI002E3194BD|nr:transposase family protein [Streptomyces sp. NBC_01455]